MGSLSRVEGGTWRCFEASCFQRWKSCWAGCQSVMGASRRCWSWCWWRRWCRRRDRRTPDPGPWPYEGDGPPHVRYLRAQRRPTDPPAALSPAPSAPSTAHAPHRSTEPLGPGAVTAAPPRSNGRLPAVRRLFRRQFRAQPTAMAVRQSFSWRARAQRCSSRIGRLNSPRARSE